MDFQLYPGQTYLGKPWSNWGDSLVVGKKYYSAIGDHFAINAKSTKDSPTGTAFVFEYDADSQVLRKLANTTKTLKMPVGHYRPGKIHTKIDAGSDGWLYYATHRGSIRATIPEFHYQGDWILRTNMNTGHTEIVAHAPVKEHAIPNGRLDPTRLIYYGGTAAAFHRKDEGIWFFAYDVRKKQLLYAGPNGPARSMILAKSTGKVYYVPGNDEGELFCFDPSSDSKKPYPLKGTHIGIRAATDETKEGLVYTISRGQRANDATIWAFDVKSEQTRKIGSAAVGSQAYVASLHIDPTGRFLYYIPGAHGSSPRDGSAVVQYDLKTSRKKVIAFLEPFYTNKYGFTLKGTYGLGISPEGDKLYVTWNVSRNSKAWDCCGLTVIHIPESERK